MPAPSSPLRDLNDGNFFCAEKLLRLKHIPRTQNRPSPRLVLHTYPPRNQSHLLFPLSSLLHTQIATNRGIFLARARSVSVSVSVSVYT